MASSTAATTSGFCPLIPNRRLAGSPLHVLITGRRSKRQRHHHRRCVITSAQRPTWLPGLDPPPYLDGTLAGDFGFDPLGLGEDPKSLKWYVQAELVHARFAMAAVAGILLTDVSH
ncbi:hypothetical protein AMTRI_Chr04g185340 [Amborella trichopoda]